MFFCIRIHSILYIPLELRTHTHQEELEEKERLEKKKKTSKSITSSGSGTANTGVLTTSSQQKINQKRKGDAATVNDSKATKKKKK